MNVLAGELNKLGVDINYKTALAATSSSLQLDDSSSREILSTLMNLHRSRARADLPAEQFVEALTEAVERRATDAWKADNLEIWKMGRPAITDALAPDTPIFYLEKSIHLTYSHQNILTSTEVITDLRPVFNESGEDLVRMIVTQVLAINYFDGFNTPISSSPVAGDVDNDGSQEVFFGNDAGYLYGLSPTGEVLSGFPIKTGNKISAAAFLWDIDDDGTIDVGVRGSDQTLYCWNTPWPFTATLAWPKFKRGSSNDGFQLETGTPSQTGIGDNHGKIVPTLTFANPSRQVVSFEFVAPEGGRLHIIDLTGRVVYAEEIEPSPNTRQFTWRGVTTSGRSLSAGLYIVRFSGKTRITKKLLFLR